ncbi:type I methionyl aminopeptidase [Candidatus Dojkabacteria bacterium]|nr:type I methionyl aminopeptidase [Candidatus Dojkabacteria bacterium]
MVNVILKTEREIRIMREAGKILAQIIKKLSNGVKRGISTYDINGEAKDLCKYYKVNPAFLGYKGYPAATCLGVNDTVVHGIPSKEEILKEGDIISIDMGIIYKGYYSDCAVTVGVGSVPENAQRLISATRDSLEAAINQAKKGKTVGDIGYAIQSITELAGFSVVKQMVGHGIGKALHEDPQIPGFGKQNTGVELKEGMVFAIEAIVNEGSERIKFLKDGWTTKTEDGKLSALFEHSVAITRQGTVVLTAE